VVAAMARRLSMATYRELKDAIRERYQKRRANVMIEGRF
jgi:hypothetical protein